MHGITKDCIPLRSRRDVVYHQVKQVNMPVQVGALTYFTKSEVAEELGVSRQTLYRHMDPTGRLRPDGEKLLGRKRKGRVPSAERTQPPA